MQDSDDSHAVGPPTTQTRKICEHLNTQEWLKLVSNLAIPIVIGVFTIFISIHQQNVAQTNRDKDDKLTGELRHNDTEQARQRREEDKETSRLQRQVDLKIAADKLSQEYELAEKQRNLYQNQRADEMKIAEQNYMSNLMLTDDRRKENTLADYQRQLTKHLLHYNSIINISYSTFIFVIQMRTRAALRLLNPRRRTILVHTLIQADLDDEIWKGKQSPLNRVNASGVDFGLPPDYNLSRFLTVYDYLSMEHADIRYASFHSVHFKNSPSFAYSNLDYTDWSFAEFKRIKFEKKMTMNNARFAHSFLIYITFGEISMNRVSFQYNTKCEECIFARTSLLHARFDHSTFFDSTFTSLSMADSNMSNGSFFRTKFEHSILDRVDLSGADLFHSTFLNVSMMNCSIVGAIFEGTQFINVNHNGCKGWENV